MKRKTLKFQLTFITISIITFFMIVSSFLFILFINYLSHVIERIYGIDDDILIPFVRIMIIVVSILIISGVIISLVGANLISQQVNQNIQRFTDKIQLIKKQDTTHRLPKLDNELDTLGNEFNEMMDQIELSLDQQNQFVQDASHEFKTPLAILLGNVEMLQRWGKDDPDILKQALDTCHSEIERMIQLSQQLLTLSMPIEEESLDLVEIDILIRERIRSYQALFEEFIFHYQSDGKYLLAIKEEHFMQILTILLDNAVKYSRLDSKTVEITKTNNVLEIKDYGTGIEEAKMNKIFNRFYRGDASRKNTNNSFGLGLAILKRLQERYQFDIKVESKINEYTKFIIYFKEV